MLGCGDRYHCPPGLDRVDSIDRLVGQVAEAGKLQVEVLEFEYCVPQPIVSRLLKLDNGQKVQRAVRVRNRQGGIPVMHLTTYVPEQIGRTYSKKDLGRYPLYQLLGRIGKSYRKAQQTVGACLADPIVGAPLKVSVGSPLIFIQRVLFTERNEPVEYLELRAPPDLYALSMSWKADDALTVEHGQFVQAFANL